MLSWLRDVPRKLRRRKKERFIKALERQLDEMYDADAAPAIIEAKRAAILRARSELSTLLMACMLLGCQHVSTRDALEVAVIGAQEARLACPPRRRHVHGRRAGPQGLPQDARPGEHARRGRGDGLRNRGGAKMDSDRR